MQSLPGIALDDALRALGQYQRSLWKMPVKNNMSSYLLSISLARSDYKTWTSIPSDDFQ